MFVRGSVREIAAKHINEAALDQRADVEKLNTSLRGDLEGKGFVFNDVDKAQFRDKLRAAGFYNDWRGKYGDKAWGVLEQYAGKLP